jgi:hypothetical protein
MKIISPRTFHEHTAYSLCFDWEDMPGAGFAFPCDKEGKVNEAELHQCARDNLRMCLQGEDNVEMLHHTYWEPAIGECNRCGNEVVLDSFTNSCSQCYLDYNQSGQQLAPREQWGEETGEDLSDILRGGDPFDGDY